MEADFQVNRPAQQRASRRIRKTLLGMHPVDAMAALETVVANMVADYAASRADAEKGLEATYRDMRNVILLRFPEGGVQ